MNEPIITLDFSKYPHATEEKLPIDKQKRYESLAKIKEIMENLIQTMQVFVNESVDVEGQLEAVRKERLTLANYERDLGVQEQALMKREDEAKEKLQFAKTLQLQLIEKEKGLQADKDKIKAIEVATGEYEERKHEALTQERIVDEKRQQLKSLEEKEQTLDKREAEITKREEIDKERKSLLDVREERIAATERRLKIQREE